MADKNLIEMSDQEIEAKIRYWEEKLKKAKPWGTAMAEAEEFIKNAREELKRRRQWAWGLQHGP